MTDTTPQKTCFSGKIENVSIVEGLDGQVGRRYFAFALLELPFPPPPAIPAHTVFYVDPDREFADNCARAVVAAWWRQHIVDVHLDLDDPADMRVCAVVPHTTLSGPR